MGWHWAAIAHTVRVLLGLRGLNQGEKVLTRTGMTRLQHVAVSWFLPGAVLALMGCGEAARRSADDLEIALDLERTLVDDFVGIAGAVRQRNGDIRSRPSCSIRVGRLEQSGSPRCVALKCT